MYVGGGEWGLRGCVCALQKRLVVFVTVSGSGRQQCHRDGDADWLCLLLCQGLAGSSAIVTATLKCLMEFFNLNHTVSSCYSVRLISWT